jgi:hypothetical protein
VCSSKVSARSKHIEQGDLQVFLPEEQAKDCMEAFDCDADGHISAEDMREAVLQIYDNRKNLAATLKDTKTIVGKLERLLGICLQSIFIFFYLAIFDVSHPFPRRKSAGRAKSRLQCPPYLHVTSSHCIVERNRCRFQI